MKVLQITHSDSAQGGGGAISMYRLHRSLNQCGVESKILSGLKTLAGSESQAISRNAKIERQLNRVTIRLGLNDIHCVSSFDLLKHPCYQESDLLNFHILHSGFFSYLAISSLTAQKPAVWTLHDMWSFTGHCAYSYDCDRWKSGCGQCPYPETYPSVRRDSTAWEWRLKRNQYDRANLTIVAPSRWLTEQAKQSLLKRFEVHWIPNGIDTTVYQPLDKLECRSLLGIPAQKKVLLFGAESLKDRRKGGDLLVKALEHLPASLKTEIVLLTLGGNNEIGTLVGIEAINLGYVSHDRLKAMAYSAADLFVFPTRADNLPLMLQESMACGTPMVSFDVGGVPDLVRPGVTGYLAAPEDPIDFASGIVKLLDDDDLRQHMQNNCRSIAIAEFALPLQAQRYKELYHQILQTS
ncbi:group 1 glycosyl transferase [Leptolyngbya boryana NIES-2135]|jgi:glycosyltransferase involved in cell wall biosynthesis|uniref:Group 1 glycosyl transferase n=1 Tax=Leptolyngbya boryana NIES-2135 TaxID=1973484 RepID=A0A1Z4JBD7_LEPBY|nr:MULTISPECIES: glycosyltransferase family 4 protein [Leptolyngbya]BAY54084.1 group 1 glycosyl transferase [Leptolyngbya boryana NIES-2135]MBD2369741.1 glycosyltransferase family 4 protein [Leptolyngbya sp. FACHB-161]MBD2376058.1 glycosyltransferase family 4 protein [Leptolyngbya sp. FACHB-238]MBD2400334.1 glycosyltransferase family 4 protein [Leptolyngbya sp. FACHB-239]MBD2406875.1 glycosyltransferase family 4 protein [Leptolyngbya sp. FACHB-402]